ncbi:elongation factor Ts, mitochondrial [Caerostris extrusa]|uniref:Elongation factor Ts, mitochondrial n=1 Tax=Caerostris extrusa TaxID=172846 RepID=A0AAV4U957_CAEEX|nr:elongation factor Ts, mitochondrial [Caerostris extrusa]
MLGAISRRFFHSSKAYLAVSRSSALGKLRKSTGYSVSNCKKALEMFPDDISKAEEWLHAEAKQQGWAKWSKIQSRSATQGLVGVFSKDKIGIMVEVNCETDFVARNAEFQQLVGNILSGCANHINAYPATESITKKVLDEAQLKDIKCNTITINELVNSAINKFNEKTVVKRAVCYKVKDNISLGSLSHPTTVCPNLEGALLGKYGTLLVYKNNSNEESVKNVSLGVCQHIIGMNPSAIGELTENDIKSFNQVSNVEENNVEAVAEKEIKENTGENPDESEEKTEGQDTLDTNLNDNEDTRLLFQPFLLDTNVTVGEIVYKDGLEIVDFERFECGQNSAENIEVKEASSISI